MRSVFLCEGKTDVALVDKFVEQLDDDFECDLFHGETVEHSRLRNRESEEIRDFIRSYRYHPFDVLAKSENGRENLTANVAHFSESIVEWDVQFHLLIDLDNDDDLDALFSELTKSIRSRHTRPPEFRDRRTLYRTDELVAARIELTIRDGVVADEIGVVAFDPDLEEVAGITEEDGDDEQARKLDRLLARDSVFEALHATVR